AEVVNLLDRRRDEDKISAIVRSRPDLILIVGGTDGGAQTSVMQLVDLVTMATELMPRSQRPRIIFAGNQELAPLLGQRLGDQYDIAVAPNARPRLHQENLTQARLAIGEAIAEVRSKRATGFDELDQWSGGSLGLTADAYGRVFRYLSRIYDPEKGVLGIDVGATHTMIAAAFEGDLRLSVESELGLGSTVHNILRRSDLERVMRWLPFEISVGRMRDYIFNKAMNPTTVPTVPDDLALEMALTREIIRVALLKARENWPRGKNLTSTWVMPPVEPIIASGGSLSRAPSAGMAALAMLDGVQPTGVTTLVLDPHNLSPSLGAAAGSVPLLSVHVLESGSYVSLGTVVSPVGQARAGRRILTLRLEPEDSNEDIAGEIRMGQLVVLPLGQGAYGRLTLRPERGIDVGFGGPGKAGALRVAGGAVGLIIDARGRPLALPQDPAMRLELNDQWLRDIGARE
ncbi:MAG: glutamate mutase L, partial [Anaerolineales bacterium]